MEIRAFTVSYSKRKSFRSCQAEAELLKKLNVLQGKLDCNFNPHTNKELMQLYQAKTREISESKTQGCILRSRCCGYELGGRKK